MAKCKFPLALERSIKKGGKKLDCSARGRFTIIFQGREILVCKVHKQYDGRDGVFG